MAHSTGAKLALNTSEFPFKDRAVAQSWDFDLSREQENFPFRIGDSRRIRSPVFRSACGGWRHESPQAAFGGEQVTRTPFLFTLKFNNMKCSKVLSLISVLGLTAAPLEAAVFASDFEGLLVGDMNGQGGWTTTETTPEASYVGEAAGNFGTQSGFLGSAGFVPTVSSSEVYVKNSFGGVSNLANLEFSVLFQMYDSSNSRASRDTFGFRLKDSGGGNLFSFVLTPAAQSANPDGTLGQWSFGYTTGSGPVIPFYSNPQQTLVWAADEDAEYDLSVTFAELGLSGDVQMNVNVNGLTIGSGVLGGLASSSVNEVGVFWRPTSGPSSTGDNGLTFDNIIVVPEPGVASLAGIAGLLCLMARRRA